MMSIEQIRSQNAQVASQAAKKRNLPFVPTVQEVEDAIAGHPAFKLPNFGDYRPKGWTLVTEFFVDHSGFGGEGESALTIHNFFRRMAEFPDHGFATIESGQFQCWVGVFKQLPARGHLRRVK